MPKAYSNIVLIGMPGAGKSTIGVLLAKKAALGFIDTDVVIQQCQKRRLQQIVHEDGLQAFRAIEENSILKLDISDHVIATGGSVVYSETSMRHLSKNAVVIFLDVSFEELSRRIGDFSQRGLVKPSDMTFEQLYHKRLPLYKKYADKMVTCTGLNPDEICSRMLAALEY